MRLGIMIAESNNEPTTFGPTAPGGLRVCWSCHRTRR
jgi:hypothetical protein